MKFENRFVVQAPIADVWQTLMDVQRVAPCMPGAEVLEQVGDNAYKVAVKVKVGPISMTYRGQVEIVERDDDARRATMHAKAKEARGQGTADARIHMSLAEQADGTHATIETEVQLSGRAAAMGRGVIGDVAEKLIQTFAANLAEMLVAEPAGVADDAAAAGGPAAGGAAAGGDGAPASADTTAGGAAAGGDGAPASADTTAGGTRQPRAQPPESEGPTTPPRTAPASGDQPALPAGEIAASVIAGRLSNPRTLLIATAAVAIASGAIGYAIGKAS